MESNSKVGAMKRMTSAEIHQAIRAAMAEVSRRLAAGELDRSGRFYSDSEWQDKLASLGSKCGPAAQSARRRAAIR
jgi:hypothetical protein